MITLFITYIDGEEEILGPFDEKAEAEWIVHSKGDRVKSWFVQRNSV